MNEYGRRTVDPARRREKAEQDKWISKAKEEQSESSGEEKKDGDAAGAGAASDGAGAASAATPAAGGDIHSRAPPRVFTHTAAAAAFVRH